MVVVAEVWTAKYSRLEEMLAKNKYVYNDEEIITLHLK